MSDAVIEKSGSPATLPTLGWAVRRAVLGVTIMLLGVAGAACLLYFAIDSDSEARADTTASVQSPGSFLYRLSRPAQ